MSLSALILYHADCTDGACAAWAARYHCERAGYSCTLIPAAPGQCPDEAFARSWQLVLAVDMCPPVEAIAMLALSASVHILDHHRTNRELVERSHGIYDEARSGAGLAWDEVPAIVGVPPLPRPWFVDYIEDRDLWRFALNGSKAINAALCFGDRTVERIDQFAKWSNSHEAFRAGEQILKVQAATVAQVAKHPILTTRMTFVCSAVEQSEIGAALVAEHQRPACVWYTRDTDAGPVAQVSLRSRDDLADVSEVAARLGGGGHRNASGAVVPLKRWFNELARWLDLGVIGPVVVQAAVRTQGLSASLSLDAIGPVSLARRVFVASPYAGDIAANEAYARACMSDSLARDEAPFLPHLLYTQVLPEDGGAGRKRGLDAAKAMLAGCDLLAVYEDRGVSPGMAGEIEHAARLGVPVERRRIGL